MSHNYLAALFLKKVRCFRRTKTPQSRKVPEGPGRSRKVSRKSSRKGFSIISRFLESYGRRAGGGVGGGGGGGGGAVYGCSADMDPCESFFFVQTLPQHVLACDVHGQHSALFCSFRLNSCVPSLRFLGSKMEGFP